MLVYELMHSETFADSYRLVSVENCGGEYLTIEEMEALRNVPHSSGTHIGEVNVDDISEDEFAQFGWKCYPSSGSLPIKVGVVVLNVPLVDSIISECVQLMDQLPENRKTAVFPVNLDGLEFPMFHCKKLVVSDMSYLPNKFAATQLIKDLVQSKLLEHGLKLHGRQIRQKVPKKD